MKTFLDLVAAKAQCLRFYATERHAAADMASVFATLLDIEHEGMPSAYTAKRLEREIHCANGARLLFRVVDDRTEQFAGCWFDSVRYFAQASNAHVARMRLHCTPTAEFVPP